MTVSKVKTSQRLSRLNDTTYKDYYRFRSITGNSEATRDHYKSLLDSGYKPSYNIPRFDRTSGNMVEIIIN